MINKTYMYLYVHGFVLLSCRYEVNKYVLHIFFLFLITKSTYLWFVITYSAYLWFLGGY